MLQIIDPQLKSMAREKDLRANTHDKIFRYVSTNVQELVNNDLSWSDDEIDKAIRDGKTACTDATRRLGEMIDRLIQAHGGESPDTHTDAWKHIEWAKRQITIYRAWAKKPSSQLKNLLGQVPQRKRTLKTKELQHPILQSSSRAHTKAKTIAIIDLKASFTMPYWLEIGGIYSSVPDGYDFSGNPESWKSIEPQYREHLSINSTWFIDVRSTTDNIGQIIREINLIRDYLPTSEHHHEVIYCVIAPMTDDTAEILEDADIYPISYDTLVVSP